MSYSEPGPSTTGSVTTAITGTSPPLECNVNIADVPVGHLMVVWFNAYGPSTWLGVDTAPAGWGMMYGPGDNQHSPLLLPASRSAFFKVKGVGDTSPAVFTAPRTSNLGVTWRMMSWSNPRVDFPIDNPIVTGVQINVDSLGKRLVMAALRANSERSAHVLHIYCDDSAPPLVTGATGLPVRTTYVDELVTGGTVPGIDDRVLTIERQAAVSEHYNLLGFTEALDTTDTVHNWTLFNVNSEGVQPLGSLPGRTWQFASSTANAQHYISRTVSLTAGQKYVWSTRLYHETSGRLIYLEVVPPVSAALGQFFDLGNNSSFDYREDIGAGFEDTDVQQGHGYGAGTDAPHVIHAVFTAPETGTYTLRIGWATDAIPPNRTFAGSGTDEMQLCYSGVMADDGMLGGDILSNYATPPLSGYAMRMRAPKVTGLVISDTTDPPIQVALEVLNKNAAVRRAYFVPDATLNNSAPTLTADGLSTRVTQVYYPISSGFKGTAASRPIYPYNSIPSHPTKFYFEVTLNSVLNPGGGDAEIGICELGGHPSSASYSPSDLRDWACVYQPNGHVHVYSVLTVTGSAWVAGDVIGVRVDMAAGTIVWLRNNVVVHTGTLRRTNVMLVALYRPLEGTVRWLSTVNLAGPFTYVQAGDVSAYDWLTDGPPPDPPVAVVNNIRLLGDDAEGDTSSVVLANLPDIRPAINILPASNTAKRPT